MGSITLLNFPSINPEKQTITKYIRIWHQKQPILNVYVYTKIKIKKPKEENKPLTSNNNLNSETTNVQTDIWNNNI